jgi:hypothetical protein
MVTYSIHPGQTNFRPLENPLPRFKVKGFTFSAKFLPGGWCSKEEWEGDADWFDWQKLKGITKFGSANNKQTAFIAFRFGVKPETYEITAYTNDSKAGWVVSKDIIIIETGEVIAGSCDFKDNQAVYDIKSEGGEFLKESHTLKNFCIGREVGTFAGGANNSPGPFGGVAFKKMQIEIDFNILK